MDDVPSLLLDGGHRLNGSMRVAALAYAVGFDLMIDHGPCAKCRDFTGCFDAP